MAESIKAKRVIESIRLPEWRRAIATTILRTSRIQDRNHSSNPRTPITPLHPSITLDAGTVARVVL